MLLHLITYKSDNGGKIAEYEVQEITKPSELVPLYEQDITKLESMINSLSGLSRQACSEIIKSRKNSLEKGISFRHNSQTHIMVVVREEKRLIRAGDYGEDTRKEKTSEKDHLEKELLTGKIRTWKRANIIEMKKLK